MKGKNLLILVIVAGVLVGLAVMTSRKQPVSEPPEVVGEALLPDLPLNDVQAIVVTSADREARVEKAEDAWVCRNKFDYPADFKKIKDALVRLSELKIGQVVTASEGQRGELDLLPPDTDAEGAGTRLELLGRNGAKLACLMIGAAHERKSDAGPRGRGGYPDGKYVAPCGSGDVYLIGDLLYDISADPADWIDKQILNVPSADVRKAVVTDRDGESFTLVKQDNQMVLTDLDADHEMDSSKLYNIRSAFSYLRMSDVADPALSDAEMGLDAPAHFELHDADGRIYTALIGSEQADGDRHYARFSVALAPDAGAATQGDAGAAEGDDDAEQDEDAAPTREELEEEIRELNARLQKWTYLVASSKAEAWSPERSSLVKEKEKPEADADEPQEEAAEPAQPDTAQEEAEETAQ